MNMLHVKYAVEGMLLIPDGEEFLDYLMLLFQ